MMSTDASYPSRPDLKALSLLPLFRHVPRDLIIPLVEDENAIRYYHDGEVILHQGDPAESLFILLRGQVRVIVDGIFLVARKPSDLFGELAFINHTTRNATVVAQGTVQALVLLAPLVERLMTDATFTSNLLRLVAEKLDEATQERAFRFRNEALLFSEFRAHLSPEVAQRLLTTGKRYGTPRYIDAVLLFADIRSFTERSAHMTPEQLVQELTPYLDVVVSVIHRHEGMVDKFIGDAVFALWGIAPGTHDPVQQAFACARELLANVSRLSFGDEPIALGIGLNTGRVFIGNVGGEGKRQFTVLGHPVNMAARYEDATKELQAPLVIGETLACLLPETLRLLLKRHEQVAIRGAGSQTLYTYDPAG